ncbi:MAG: Eco57I restriction-modification methylase domain-containing protein [Candidatus Promineifilaceae bacterium]
MPWLTELYERESALFPSYSESQLEDNWFKPIFRKLGHTFEGQARVPGLGSDIKFPDFVFFADDAARQHAAAMQKTADYAREALAAGEVKAWDVPLGKKQKGTPSFDNNNPSFQIDYYLRATDLSWVYLSNGRLWRLVHKDSSYKIHAKEDVLGDVRGSLDRWRKIADLWTSSFFGNEMSPEEYADLVRALQGQESMLSTEQQGPYLNHPALLHNDYFHWELAFPEVFFDQYGRSLADAAGFDAVIGNPPYIRMESFKQLKDFLRKEFLVYETRTDIYAYFLEKSFAISRVGTHLGFVVSNKWLRSKYGQKLRKLLLSNVEIHTLIDFEDLPVFEATTYPLILIAESTPPSVEHKILITKMNQLDFAELAEVVQIESSSISQHMLTENEWNL